MIAGAGLTYLCGNSLGLMPKRTQTLIAEELDVWKTRAVEGHFDHPYSRPWKSCDELVKASLAGIVGKNPFNLHHHANQISGANEDEVVAMGQLTSNLHKLLVSFYRPTAERYKIVFEDNAFPSDNVSSR